MEVAEGPDEWCGPPRWLAASAAGPGAAELTENYISSNAKIKAALIVERMPVEAREGLRRTLVAFKG